MPRLQKSMHHHRQQSTLPLRPRSTRPPLLPSEACHRRPRPRSPPALFASSSLVAPSATTSRVSPRGGAQGVEGEEEGRRCLYLSAIFLRSSVVASCPAAEEQPKLCPPHTHTPAGYMSAKSCASGKTVLDLWKLADSTGRQLYTVAAVGGTASSVIGVSAGGQHVRLCWQLQAEPPRPALHGTHGYMGPPPRWLCCDCCRSTPPSSTWAGPTRAATPTSASAP